MHVEMLVLSEANVTVFFFFITEKIMDIARLQSRFGPQKYNLSDRNRQLLALSIVQICFKDLTNLNH